VLPAPWGSGGGLGYDSRPGMPAGPQDIWTARRRHVRPRAR